MPRVSEVEDIFRLFKEREEKAKKMAFKNNIEYLIFGSLIASVLSSPNRLVIYEVENFENLFDYADLFMRVRNLRSFKIFNKHVSFVVVTSYPHDVDIAESVEVAIQEETTPIVAYFVGDFLPYGEGMSADMKELMRTLSMALFNRVCYVVMFTTNPMILYDNIPLARYGVVMRDVAPKVIQKVLPRRAIYASTVGFQKVITMKPSEISAYLKKRKLPAPHTIAHLKKDVVFDELVIPTPIKEFIRLNVINPLKMDFTLISSLLFVGPSGAGKTTLAYAIAQVLGVPATLVRVELMSSKWLGESEKIANQTMLLLNDRAPVVAVFRDIELILGQTRGGGEETPVFERIRAIIATWLRSSRRRFMAVFTVSDPSAIPDYILRDASFGVFKLPILPPLKVAERERMLSLFLKKLSRKYGLRFDPLKESTAEGLQVVAEETWAYTPRELMDIAQTAVNITLDKGQKEITKENIQLAKKYKEIDRISRVEIMLEAVKACKKVGIPEPLLVDVYRFEEEVEKLKAEAYAEEAKKKSFVRLSV